MKLFIKLFILYLISFPYHSKGIRIRWEKLPDLSVGTNQTQGISGAFAGTIDGILYVAGGCNFPNIPVADGGSKVFYKPIYCLQVDPRSNKGWRQCGDLPYPVAYGVSITLPNGILCIGGCNSRQRFSNVFLLKCDKQKQQSVIQSFPSLPITFDNMSGAKVGNYVYIAGGNANGIPSKLCFRLNLRQINHGWEQLPSYPGMPRVQPVAVAQHLNREECLFLLGGYTPYSHSSKGRVNTNGYVFIPSLNRWRTIKSPYLFNQDLSITGGAGMAFQNRYIMCFGGVNKTIFQSGLLLEYRLNQAFEAKDTLLIKSLTIELKNYLSHNVAWYRYNQKGLVYDVKSNKWSCIDQNTHSARAGCSLIDIKRSFFIIGGELKPGIRAKSAYKGFLEK